jgi:hypothetical protein
MAKKNLQTLLAEYHEKAAESTPAQIATMTKAIKEARAAEQAELSQGAKPCKRCGHIPHIIKQQASKRGIVFHYYEVGCLDIGCYDEIIQDGEVVGQEHWRVKDSSLEQAIKGWNQLYA